MKHYIIIKWNKDVIETPQLYKDIEDLFNLSLDLLGIHSINFFHSCIDLPNRFDYMICIDMERDALKRFDDSSIHMKWKKEYSSYIESKTIFDC